MIIFRSTANPLFSLRDPLKKRRWELNAEDDELEQSVSFFDNEINYAKKDQVKYLKSRKPFKKINWNDIKDAMDGIARILSGPDSE